MSFDNHEQYHEFCFSRDFCRGEIYVRRPGQGYLYYPLDYPLDELLLINLLSKGRGVLVHAFAVDDNGRGIVFAGTSGAGKSTLATLWEKQEGVTLLSDDRVILRMRQGRLWIYGTPWHGDARAASPEGVPLEQIYLIKHAGKNQAIPLNPLDAVSCLLVRSFPTFWDAEGMDSTLEFLEQVSYSVPCHELGFVPDDRVIDFVRSI